MKKSNTKVMATVAPLVMAMGLVFVSTGAIAGKYAISAGTKAVVPNAYGECWKSKGAVEKMVEKCGDAMPQEAAPAPVAAVDGDMDNDGVPDSRDNCPNTRPGASVDSNGCEVVSNLTIDLIEDEFDFDSAALKPGMKQALSSLADKIKASKGNETLTVIGHTDSVGAAAYNQGLSERRATAAANYLQGMGVGSVSTKGMGENQPVADNSSREGRAKNRRVEITTH